MTKEITIPKLVKISSLVELIGLSRATINRMQADGSLPKAAYLIGRGKTRAWTETQVETILESMKNPKAAIEL